MKTMPNIARIYVVKPGDTLSSIAKAAYGDSSMAPTVANTNGLQNNAILAIGSRLKLPAMDGGLGDSSVLDEGTLVVTPQNQGQVSTVPVVINPPMAWLTDWRTWAVAGLVAGGLYLLLKKK
jgi:LysM repeat protein